MECIYCNLREMKCYPHSKDCGKVYELNHNDLYTDSHCDFAKPVEYIQSQLRKIEFRLSIFDTVSLGKQCKKEYIVKTYVFGKLGGYYRKIYYTDNNMKDIRKQKLRKISSTITKNFFIKKIALNLIQQGYTFLEV